MTNDLSSREGLVWDLPDRLRTHLLNGTIITISFLLGVSTRVHRQHQRYNFNYCFFFFAYRDATSTWVNTQTQYIDK